MWSPSSPKMSVEKKGISTAQSIATCGGLTLQVSADRCGSAKHEITRKTKKWSANGDYSSGFFHNHVKLMET
jgi:hypothetical protein